MRSMIIIMIAIIISSSIVYKYTVLLQAIDRSHPLGFKMAEHGQIPSPFLVYLNLDKY